MCPKKVPKEKCEKVAFLGQKNDTFHIQKKGIFDILDDKRFNIDAKVYNNLCCHQCPTNVPPNSYFWVGGGTKVKNDCV